MKKLTQSNIANIMLLPFLAQENKGDEFTKDVE